jgi:hypothetical protein
MVPQNNFYGAYYMSLEEKLLRESLAVESKKYEAIAGGGFLGEETCVEFGPNNKCIKYDILTPGKTIERQLNDVLSPPSGEKRLEIADEIDEIIAAAFQRLLTNIRGKAKDGKKQGIVSTEPLNQFIDDTKSEVPAAIKLVSNATELPQAIAMAQQTTKIKQDSISKVNSLIGVLESINSCQGGTNESRTKISKDNIKQLQIDIENLTKPETGLVAQLERGEQELAQSKNMDEVYAIFSDLKAAVDIVISLYDSAVAENNQITEDTQSAQSELDACTETQNNE